MFDAHAPETGLARNDDVGNFRDDARAGNIADDPQSFVSNHGYIAEGVRAALVGHVGQQESNGGYDWRWTWKLLSSCRRESQKQNQRATDQDFLREHSGS